MKINANNHVSVVLTEIGAEIWNARYAGYKHYGIKLPEPVEAGATVKTQLWDAMYIFGPHMYMGNEAPFVGLSMDIEPDKEQE